MSVTRLRFTNICDRINITKIPKIIECCRRMNSPVYSCILIRDNQYENDNKARRDSAHGEHLPC